MSLNRFVRQLKPIQENKVNYVDAIKNYKKTEQGHMNIDELQKIRRVNRLNILIDVINNQTKVETTKGKSSLNWKKNTDKILIEMVINNYIDKKRYKIFNVTNKGEEMILKIY